MTTLRCRIARLSVCLAVLAPWAATVRAQAPDTTAYAVPDFTSGREESELRADIDRTQVEQDNASRTADRLKDYRERLNARLQVQRTDIDAIKSRLDLAKKENRTADRTELEARRQQAELDRKALEELNSLYAAEIDESTARRDWAKAQMHSYQAELTLELKRRERTLNPPADSVASQKADNEIYDLEGKLLEARRDEASKQSDWANRYRDTVDKQAAVYRANAVARGQVKR